MIPPVEIRNELAELVGDVRVPSSYEPGRHRGQTNGLGRILGRGSGGVATLTRGELATEQLNAVAPGAMRVDIASFGHLDRSHARKLTTSLEGAAREWSAPRLRVLGGQLLEPSGDDGAWASLDCESDALDVVGRGVPLVAQRMRLYLDRRRYRPAFRVGRINDLTTEAYLEQLQRDLRAHTSAWWTQPSLSLLEHVPGLGQNASWRVLAEIPLGG